MCLECGTALNVSNSDVADQEREFIAGLIAQGRTKAQIKDALVAEYGPRVLAEPEDDGFQLTAWIVPAPRGARRARARGAGRPPLAPRATPPRRSPRAGDDAALDADDARRLDAELAAFDR